MTKIIKIGPGCSIKKRCICQPNNNYQCEINTQAQQHVIPRNLCCKLLLNNLHSAELQVITSDIHKSGSNTSDTIKKNQLCQHSSSRSLTTCTAQTDTRSSPADMLHAIFPTSKAVQQWHKTPRHICNASSDVVEIKAVSDTARSRQKWNWRSWISNWCKADTFQGQGKAELLWGNSRLLMLANKLHSSIVIY